MTTFKQRADKKKLRKYLIQFGISLLAVCLLVLGFLNSEVFATSIDIGVNTESGGGMGTLELMFLLMLLALAPSILIMMTSFTRIIIVLSFLRNALGTQQSPPNQVLIGLGIFLTLAIMAPVLKEVNDQALMPMKDGLITQEVAIERAIKPVKAFMLRQTMAKDIELFISFSKEPPNIVIPQEATLEERAEAYSDLGLEIVVPAFITSELNRAFTIGFLLFIPFLIIDMVVSSTLMSMGMVMLPPSMIALPFKLLMFILVDGWGLLFSMLVQGFK